MTDNKKTEQQLDWVEPTTTQHQMAQLEQTITLEQIQLSEKIGALKATAFVKKLVTVTEIKLLAEVKETKSYKGLKVIGEDGKPVTVTTFEQFCQNLGVSYEKVNQDIQNLSTFGEDFLETSQRMGLGYRDLRKLRKLPEDERELVINGEAVKTEDRESLIDLIEEISAKHSREKELLNKQVAELTADTQAKDTLLAKKDEKINNLDAELTKRTQFSPDDSLLAQQAREHEVLQALQTAQNNALLAFQQFHVAIDAIQQSSNCGYFDEAIQQTLNFVYQHIAQISRELGVPIDFAEMVTPAWIQAAKKEMGE